MYDDEHFMGEDLMTLDWTSGRWDVRKYRSLAANAEPYLRVTSETLGDVNREIPELYFRVTGLALVGQEIDYLPTSTEEARMLTAATTTPGESGRPLIGEFMENTDGALQETFRLNYLREDRRTRDLLPQTVPVSVAARRRTICLAMINTLWIVGQSHVTESDRDYYWDQIKRALVRLSPPTAVPLVLRKHLGGNKTEFTRQQAGKQLGVSASTIRDWEQGLRTPSREQAARGDALFGLAPGTLEAARNDQATEKFPWDM